jgi:hypothetical protein
MSERARAEFLVEIGIFPSADQADQETPSDDPSGAE